MTSRDLVVAADRYGAPLHTSWAFDLAVTRLFILQTVAAGATSGSILTAPISGDTGSPYTISATTTLTFGAGVMASANIANALEVTAPEPASMIVWSLVACSVAVPGLRRHWRAGQRTG